MASHIDLSRIRELIDVFDGFDLVLAGALPPCHTPLTVRAEGEQGHGGEAVVRVERVGPDVTGTDAHDLDAGPLRDTSQAVQMPVDRGRLPGGVGEDRSVEPGILPWAASSRSVELCTPAPSER
ncbi:hypothetical protein ACLQ22_10135 [Micromonospora sp. DT178]|uniref:hypothetical protein n=1 Tax=Micromonospora sp. DT178 TaxID=3393436 RepID=UPI003CEE4EC8